MQSIPFSVFKGDKKLSFEVQKERFDFLAIIIQLIRDILFISYPELIEISPQVSVGVDGSGDFILFPIRYEPLCNELVDLFSGKTVHIPDHIFESINYSDIRIVFATL